MKAPKKRPGPIKAPVFTPLPRAMGILALDMATSTGWALMDRQGNVTSGVQRFDLGRGESPGMRFLRFRRWLQELIHPRRAWGECHSVDVLAFERAHHRGGHATALAAGLQAIVQEEAARLGIETLPVHTATIKKHATGKGNADKQAMLLAAAGRWPTQYDSGRSLDSFIAGLDDGESDRADALCVLAWALDEIGLKEKASG